MPASTPWLVYEMNLHGWCLCSADTVFDPKFRPSCPVALFLVGRTPFFHRAECVWRDPRFPHFPRSCSEQTLHVRTPAYSFYLVFAGAFLKLYVSVQRSHSVSTKDQPFQRGGVLPLGWQVQVKVDVVSPFIVGISIKLYPNPFHILSLCHYVSDIFVDFPSCPQSHVATWWGADELCLLGAWRGHRELLDPICKALAYLRAWRISDFWLMVLYCSIISFHVVLLYYIYTGTTTRTWTQSTEWSFFVGVSFNCQWLRVWNSPFLLECGWGIMIAAVSKLMHC